MFWNLAHLDFSNMDLIFSSLVETISIAVLSLLYSLLLGIVFGMPAARNVFRLPVLSVLTNPSSPSCGRCQPRCGCC